MNTTDRVIEEVTDAFRKQLKGVLEEIFHAEEVYDTILSIARDYNIKLDIKEEV